MFRTTPVLPTFYLTLCSTFRRQSVACCITDISHPILLSPYFSSPSFHLFTSLFLPPLSLLSQLTNWIQFTPLQLLRVLKLLLAIFRNTALFLDPYVRSVTHSSYQTNRHHSKLCVLPCRYYLSSR